MYFQTLLIFFCFSYAAGDHFGESLNSTFTVDKSIKQAENFGAHVIKDSS